MLSTCADTTLIGRRTTHIFSRRQEHRPSSVVSFMGWVASEGFVVSLIQPCLITEMKEERKEHTQVIRHCNEIQRRIQGRGPGSPHPPPPLIFRPNWGPKGRKNSFGDRATPFLRVWMTGAPFISRSRSGTDFLHVRGLWFCQFYTSLLAPVCPLCLACIWRLLCVSCMRVILTLFVIAHDATVSLRHLVWMRISRRNLGRFPKVRTDRPDHGRTSHFDKTISFFQEFLLKNHLLRANYLGFNISGWIVLIKSEILITTGMVWPVSSDKWKAPLVSTNWLQYYLGFATPTGTWSKIAYHEIPLTRSP